MLPIRKPKRYKFAWGGRGGAKTETYARELLRIGNERKIRVLCTREIQISIKDSVFTMLTDLISKLMYSDYIVTDNSIKHKNGTEFIFMGMWQQEKKQTLKSLANIDYCWVEESQTISEGSLTLLDPTIRKPNSEIWFSFNRLFDIDPVWRFKNRIEDSEKTEIYINYYDNPYLPDVLLKQAERSKKEYDEGISEDYLHTWLGEPYGQSDKTIFTLKEIHGAMNREPDTEGQISVGADIARFGNDRTVFFKRKGLSVIDYKIYSRLSIPESFRYLVDFVGNDTSIPIKIDDTGLGGGVTDLLEEHGFTVVPINNGESADQKDKYANLGSELWFDFKEKIGTISLPDIPELKSELVTREWKLDLKGRRQVERKEDYKKRGYRSPDLADSCLLCFYDQAIYTPMFGKRIM